MILLFTFILQVLAHSLMYCTIGLLHSMDLGTAPARTDSQGHVSTKMPKAQTLTFYSSLHGGGVFMFFLALHYLQRD